METLVSIIAILCLTGILRVAIESRLRLRELEKSMQDPKPSPSDLLTLHPDGTPVAFSAERTSRVAAHGFWAWLAQIRYLDRFSSLVARERDTLMVIARGQLDIAQVELDLTRAKDKLASVKETRETEAKVAQLLLDQQRLKLECDVQRMRVEALRDAKFIEAKLNADIALLDAQVKAAIAPPAAQGTSPLSAEEVRIKSEFDVARQTFDEHVNLREHVEKRRKEAQDRMGPEAANKIVDEATVQSGITTPADPEHASWIPGKTAGK